MGLTARERAKQDEFDLEYRCGRQAAMQAAERAVCGCDYGSTAWTTRAEADRIAAALRLAPGVRLLEIGAGSGWPALYLAGQSGCEAVLTELPLAGLWMAVERAARERMAGRCAGAAADAAALPFSGQSFDAVNHSDVLCCLVGKREVLAECRRVVRPGGRMAFSVIHVPPGLSAADHARALETAPEFAEAPADYARLLAETGWSVIERRDLTAAFAASCRRRMSVEQELREALAPLFGEAELEARLERMRRRIPVLERGHLRRDLFVVCP